MQALLHVIGMLGGIAMATAVPIFLVLRCGFAQSDALLYVMIISIVSIGCGVALCRHCLQSPSQPPRRPDNEKP